METLLGLLPLLILAAVAAAWFLVRSKRPRVAAGQRAPATEGSHWKRFSDRIPTGFQIHAGGLEVRGVHVEPHRSAAGRFIAGRDQRLAIEPEPGNPHDRFALKVIGQFVTSRGESAEHLGYVPHDEAEALATSGFVSTARARLRFVQEAEGKYPPKIEFDLLLPKEQKRALAAIEAETAFNSPISAEQKEYVAFFGLRLPKGAKFGEASAVIAAHQDETRAATPERYAEWEAYRSICEELDDAENRREYSIKTVSRKHLNETIDILRQEGMTMQALADDVQLVVDRLIEINPGLGRQ